MFKVFAKNKNESWPTKSIYTVSTRSDACEAAAWQKTLTYRLVTLGALAGILDMST
jgi:hypothetical protein